MFVLYEEDGAFKTGHIMTETEAALQVESASGKRSKIKRTNCLFTFASPAPELLLAQAEKLAESIDVPFLWEFAPKEESDVQELGNEYFGHAPDTLEKTSLLLRLHASPVYFHRRGRGRYRAAPPEILTAALAAQEKKQRAAAEIQGWADEMIAGRLPQGIADIAMQLITRPDKNSQAWKALETACTQTQKTPERLLLDLGAWPHALALHKGRFLATHFPRGTSFPACEISEQGQELPLADVQAYSIDDISTTEIDDALSVSILPDGNVRVGIHIAAPGLAVTRDSELDKLARVRMSTVYTPGEKIPMQPDDVISAFSLDAGCAVPALSLYVTANADTGEIISHESKLERVVVVENLRHNLLDADITESALDDPDHVLPYNDWIRPLWKLALQLAKQREIVRGKPENNNRVEYSFYLDGPADNPDSPVRILPRQRNAPLDRLVAEYMILANSTWGGLLASLGVPGIYRSQQTGRVRMSTHALPHEAIGVAQYAWCTSPLRRYVDLVNQWQLIAAITHGVSAPLVAPFKPRDADLFAIIGGFEAQYTAWNDFQNSMERYWCLRWLQQQGIDQCNATVLKEDLVRFSHAPLVTRVLGLPELDRGQQIQLKIMGFDELGLELDCTMIASIEPESVESGEAAQIQSDSPDTTASTETEN
ncbi:MAG: RNB domain-containing ribonuclease [Sheuella sp.]|nr:RNB domain-containing ribonuclease [Sheuella sp.]